MEKVVTKTVDALSRFGERLERRLSTGDDDSFDLNKSGSGFMFSNSGSAFRRPLDNKHDKKKQYSSKKRDLVYGGAKNYSSDRLAASPGQSSFNNYRQNPMGDPYSNGMVETPYGTGMGNPYSNGMGGSPYGAGMTDPYSNGMGGSPYGSGMGGSPYGAGMGGSMNYNYSQGYPGGSPGGQYGVPGNVGYAPDYYIAERRQVELVPAPPPRYIRQPVPVPVPVDRPVPQPYPVQVPRLVPVDRPVPVPVPTPVPVDRPVPVPVAVPVPSPPPPPVRIPVPVPVPTPVPCYIPVGVPVPSPPPSPVMVENSITHTQRWITGLPVMMNQQRYLAGSPAMGMNPCIPYGNGSFIR